MILFWLLCTALVAVALAFVLPPLLENKEKEAAEHEREQREANIAIYRDQLTELEADLRNGIVSEQQYQQDREELERRLLEDIDEAEKTGKTKTKLVAGRGPVYAVALGIPLVAVAFYLRVGNLQAISGPPVSAASSTQPSQTTDQFSQQRIDANVAALAKRLEQNPNDVAGWIMLGRSYASQQRYKDASDAYSRATALKADDADLWADYAFALAMANGQSLAGEPARIVQKALTLDPENPKALELAGTAAYQAQDYEKAIVYWEKLLRKTPPQSEVGQALTQRIAEAKSLLGGK